jgi:hypothetical protein
MNCKYCYQSDHTIENCKTIICKVCRDSGHPHWLCKKAKKGGNHKKGSGSNTSSKNHYESLSRNSSQSTISNITSSVVSESTSLSQPPSPSSSSMMNMTHSKKTMASMLASSLQTKKVSSNIISEVVSNQNETQQETNVNVVEEVNTIEIPIVSKPINVSFLQNDKMITTYPLLQNSENRNNRQNDTKRDLQFYLKQSKKNWSEIL